MSYAIEKAVRLPSRVTVRKYPLAEMDVDDSFDLGEIDSKMKARVSSAVYTYGRKHGMRFSVRNTEDGHVRVWRVE